MSLDLLIDFKPYETKVNGQVVTMELRPLTREYMILLSELFGEVVEASILTEADKTRKNSKSIKVKGKNVNIEDVKKGVKLFNDNLKHQKYADPIFKTHVRNIKGLTINGKEPTAEQFATESALCNITIDILTELVNRSNLKYNEVKN